VIEIETTGISTGQQLYPPSDESPLSVNDASVLLAPKAQLLPGPKSAFQTGGHGDVRVEARCTYQSVLWQATCISLSCNPNRHARCKSKRPERKFFTVSVISQRQSSRSGQKLRRFGNAVKAIQLLAVDPDVFNSLGITFVVTTVGIGRKSGSPKTFSVKAIEPL
jgi:hypothetical protein